MKEKEVNKKDKRKFFKRVKVIVCLSASFLVVVITTLLCILFSRFKDTNRSTYQSRGISSSEIIRKNYIEGFSDIANTGKFTFLLPEEDINELLSIGVKSLNDKYIKDIYFDIDELGYRNFYVDLVKVGVKTRVVISTIPSVKDENTIKLSISQVSMGKVNALDMLKKKGYISKEFIDPFFKASSLPITFNESSLAFEITPYRWISEFPESNIGDYLFQTAKDIEGCYSFVSNIFGFSLDVSKLTNGRVYSESDTSNVPNIYDEVKSGCISNYSEMSDGETKSIYSLSEADLNKHIKASFISNEKEEIESTLTSKKVTFDLSGVNVHVDQIDNMVFSLFFFINGYTICVDTSMHFMVTSSISFNAYLEKSSNLSSLINSSLTNVVSNLSTIYSYFEYTANEMLHLSLEALNSDPDIEVDIRYSQKAIEINPATKSIDFKLTK